MNRSARLLALPVLLSGGVACATQGVAAGGDPGDTARRPRTLAGSWALVDAAPRSDDGVRDTVIWELGSRGGLRHAVIDVEARGPGGRPTSRVRPVSQAIWWTEARRVDGEMTRVMCMSAQPARSRQCARVVVDTVTDARGSARRRLSWVGVTFPQRWVFVERTLPASGARGD